MKFKILKISIIIISISTYTFQKGFGQIFDSEQNPLSVKWRKIVSGGFTILYPTELEKEAQRMANTITKIYPSVGQSLRRQNTTLPIVLQNRGTTANGFVQLAPKKSQFYTTPPQQFDSQDWLNNLAVHELRHVAQFDKITGREKFFLTEEILFAYLGVSIPIWFFEGDAVSIETSLTNAGRGRQPSWIMPFRTSVLSGQNFSYSKAYFGSNKDKTPGYYQLGYLMASDLRSRFGGNIIDSLLTDINRHPLRLYPFSGSLKKYTGKNTNDYYLQALANAKYLWIKQDQQNLSENYVGLNKQSKYASDYFFPTQIEDGKILSLKQTKAETPGFVVLNTNKEEISLLKIGYQENPWFSYGNHIVVWDEIRQDPRYKQRSYSVICKYDLITREKHQLTSKTRLFSPSISGDGKRLVAVQADLSNRFSLVEIELTSGKILRTITNAEGAILQMPSLDQTGGRLVWISVSERGKELWIMNKDGKKSLLIPATNQQLSRPTFIGQQIVFNAHLSGIDNIYSIDPTSKKIVALTASKYGAFNASPSLDGKSIVFNNYQLMGLEVAQTAIEPKPVQANSFVYFGADAEKQENTGNVFSQIPDSNFKSAKYHPHAHLLNFHSVSFAVDEDDRLGIQLKSNDLLNLLDVYGGIHYDDDLRKMAYGAGFSFKSLYPVLSSTFTNRPRRGFYRLGSSIDRADWRENHLEIKATLPLSVNRYNHNYSATAQLGTSYTQRNFAAKEAALFAHTLKFPMSYKIGLAHSIRMAERDVAPRWGQYLNFSYFNQPFDKQLSGDLWAFESAFYFPGLARNHSLSASFNYQQSSGALSLNNEINTVYGYNQITALSALRNTLLLNYRFPILFPDLELGRIAYIRNVRGGVFSHYENIGSETNLAEPKTFGLELRSSMNLLRYQPVVDVGARLIFVNKIYHQNPILEFTFNYSF